MRERFFELLRSFDPGRHVHGVEENVRSKIFIPLVEALGWDLLEEVWLEHDLADMVLGSRQNAVIIVEIKSDMALFRAEQVLRYSIHMRIPWIVVVTPTELRIYHALSLVPTCSNRAPLLRVSLPDLSAQENFDRLVSLIGRDAALTGAENLVKATQRHLGVSQAEIEQWHSTLEQSVEVLGLGTPAASEMWLAMQPYMGYLTAFVKENADDAEMGREGSDPFVLRAKTTRGRGKIERFGRALEEYTGGRGKVFYRRMNRDNTLTMEVVHRSP